MPIYRLPVRIVDPVLGGDGVNIFHVRTGGGIGETATLNRAVGWLEDFYNAMVPVFSSNTDFFFDGVATEIATEAPGVNDDLDTWTTGGTGTSIPLPAANCIVVGWKTTLATRSGRGRTFLGPMASATAESNGTVTAAALSTIRTAASAMVDASTAADPDGVALGVWSPTDQLLRDFTGSTVRDKFAVLRSRRD